MSLPCGKKSGRRRWHAAPRRPAAGPRPQGYRRPGTPLRRPKPATDSVFTPMSVLLMVVAIGLLVGMGMILKPTNLKRIEGYPAPLIADNSRNLLAEVQQLLRPDVAGKTLTFTEAEVNRYLNERVKGKQKGMLSTVIKFRGVYVDLAPGYAEFYVVRSAFGLPFSISTRMQLEKGKYQSRWRASGGSIGSFTLSNKQFAPIVEVFLRLKEVCNDELDAIRSIGDVNIEFGDNQITFKK